MLLSMKWLNEYVDVKDIDIKDFCSAMTMSGSKVEGYRIESEEIKNVVVGKIVSISKHPDADKLVVCQIDVGSENLLQIVTGAKNVFEGALVPVALHKSSLAGGVTIKKGKLRGVLSEGMLCSLQELGLSINDFPDAIEDGILIINEECQVGQDIRSALGLDDIIVEFEITPNRPDCLSVLGLAREVAAVFNRPLKTNEKEYVCDGVIDTNLLSVDVRNKEQCSRYIAKMVENVKIEHSPRWLRERLRSSGIKPINNVVDITNYVMMKYGQPMHAFDYDKILGKELIVRNAQEGEEIELLDGSKKILDESVLVIADKERPLALAGIMGGADSGVSSDTKRIVFEIGSFDPDSVRKSSSKLAVRSESSSRFEKGVDSRRMTAAVSEICDLVSCLKAGEIVQGIVNIGHFESEERRVEFRHDFINQRLGLDLSQDQMKEMLEKLSISVTVNVAVIPSWRNDITQEEDLIEEVARLYGYDKIEPKKSNLLINDVAVRTGLQNFHNKILDFMVSKGYYETKTFSFISPKYYDKINLCKNDKLRESVVITNPLGEDTSVMRTTAIPSMLEVISKNYSNQSVDGKFFEIAKEYIPVEGSDLPIEKDSVIAGLYGKKNSFYDLKFVIEDLFNYLGIKNYSFISQKNNAVFHPGRCADIFANEDKIGVIGQIHPLVAENYQVMNNVFVVSLDIEKMFKNMSAEKVYEPISKFPSVTRDLSLVCDRDLPVMVIEDLIRKTAGSCLEGIELIDVYEGGQLSNECKKSICYSLKIRSFDKTLTDEEISSIIDSILIKLDAIDVNIRSF